MSSVPVGMALGFSIFCLVSIFKPEYLASTYFIREKYSPTTRLLFRGVAAVFCLGGMQMTTNLYRDSWKSFGPEPPNLLISSAIGVLLGLFFVLFVEWGEKENFNKNREPTS